MSSDITARSFELLKCSDAVSRVMRLAGMSVDAVVRRRPPEVICMLGAVLGVAVEVAVGASFAKGVSRDWL